MEINDLPPEILVTIFEFIPQEEIVRSVNHVCTLWRELAMSGSLWTHVDLDRLTMVVDMNHDDLFSALSSALEHVQYLKVSPMLLESYFARTKGASLKNLHTLQLLNSQEFTGYIGKILPLLPIKCPQLKDIHVGVILGIHFCVLEAFLSLRMNLNQLHLYMYSLHDEADEDSDLFADDDRIVAHDMKEAFQSNPDVFSKYKEICLHSMPALYVDVFLQQELSNLRCLDGNFPTGNTIRSVVKIGANLTHLRFGFAIRDDGCFHVLIGALPNLKVLRLECLNFLRDKVVSDLITSCKNIEEISVRNSTVQALSWNTFEGESLSKLTLSCIPPPTKIKALKVLSVQNLKAFDNLFLTDLVQNLYLESLSLNSCQNVDDASLEIIASNCNYLRSADLSQCSGITLLGVQKVLSSCMNLVNLSLLACEGLKKFPPSNMNNSSWKSGNKNSNSSAASTSTDETTSSRKNSKLQNLNMAYCINLEASAVVAITEMCNGLRLLNLRFCDSISNLDDVKNQLFQNCPCLKAIYIGLNDIVDVACYDFLPRQSAQRHSTPDPLPPPPQLP